MLPILVSSHEVQNNLLVFTLNSPDLAEMRQALTALHILPEEINHRYNHTRIIGQKEENTV